MSHSVVGRTNSCSRVGRSDDSEQIWTKSKPGTVSFSIENQRATETSENMRKNIKLDEEKTIVLFLKQMASQNFHHGVK